MRIGEIVTFELSPGHSETGAVFSHFAHDDSHFFILLCKDGDADAFVVRKEGQFAIVGDESSDEIITDDDDAEVA